MNGLLDGEAIVKRRRAWHSKKTKPAISGLRQILIRFNADHLGGGVTPIQLSSSVVSH